MIIKIRGISKTDEAKIDTLSSAVEKKMRKILDIVGDDYLACTIINDAFMLNNRDDAEMYIDLYKSNKMNETDEKTEKEIGETK